MVSRLCGTMSSTTVCMFSFKTLTNTGWNQFNIHFHHTVINEMNHGTSWQETNVQIYKVVFIRKQRRCLRNAFSSAPVLPDSSVWADMIRRPNYSIWFILEKKIQTLHISKLRFSYRKRVSNADGNLFTQFFRKKNWKNVKQAADEDWR